MGAIDHLRAYEGLAKHEKLSDLVGLTRALVEPAARAKTTLWRDAEGLEKKREELGLERDAAKTDFGSVLDVLDRGPEDDAERALAAALYAHVVAEAPPKKSEDCERVAADLLFLATHTPFDALPLVDRALGDDAGELWLAVADRVRRIDTRRLPSERAEALLGCAALAMSTSKQAAKQAAALVRDLGDPTLARILRVERDERGTEKLLGELLPSPRGPVATAALARDLGDPTLARILRVERDERGTEKLLGELLPSPRGPVATAALALTGILFVMHAARIVARFALAYRRPTEVTLDGDGVRVRAKTQLLGRTLRDSETVIAKTGLVHATREVRYPRAAFYAGLLALAAGSYLGVRTLVDGARSASPSLLLVGLLFVTIGIALDFALTSIAPSSAGRCSVLFVPKAGRTLCIGNVDAKRADAALARLAGAKA
jgi:hypothetical protein